MFASFRRSALALPGLAALLAVPALARAQTPAPVPPSPDVIVQVPAAAPAPQAKGAAPAGWMGIHYICEMDSWTKGREHFVRHNGYPLIASVEPGSPADRAGIQAGDTILAYDNADVNGRIFSLTKLLTPGRKVSVKVRRARQTYDIPVVVGKRTIYGPDVAILAPGVNFYIDSLTATKRVAVVRDHRTPRPVVAALPADTMIVGPLLRAQVLPPAPPIALAWSRTSALAGAELAPVNPELGESFGVTRGLLVIGVAPNTPAAQAGLRGGDVIIRADEMEVVRPAQLQRVLERAADEQQVKLVVVRKKKEIVVPLKW